MTTVTLDMTPEEATSLLEIYRKAQTDGADWLAGVTGNVIALERALSPVIAYQIIPSETDPDFGLYTVTRAEDDKYSCDCKSFQYVRSLDDNGYCKHIRRAIENKDWWR